MSPPGRTNLPRGRVPVTRAFFFLDELFKELIINLRVVLWRSSWSSGESQPIAVIG